MFERIDMAVFAALPDLVRLSLLVNRVREQPQVDGAAGLLGAMSRRAGASHAVSEGGDPWLVAYAELDMEDVVLPHDALMAWAGMPSGVPSQGPLADVVNAFSLQHRVPTAVYQIQDVEDGLWLRPSRGCEHYWGIGAASPESPPLGELILVDSADRVLARNWHGEQGHEFVVRSDTQRAIVHVDLLPPHAADAEALGEQLSRLLAAYVADEVRVQRLDWHRPQVVWGEVQSGTAA